MSEATTQHFPPMDDPVRGRQLMSEALGAAPVMARLEAQQKTLEVLRSPALDDRVLQLLDTRFNRRYRPRLVLSVGVLVTALCALFYFVIMNQVSISTQLTADHAEIATLQQTLESSNVKLQAQGLPPVYGPTDPQPNTPEQATLITAAATASTLASLPPTILKDPSADALGKAVATYMGQHSGQVYGPLSQQLIDNLAHYEAINREIVRVESPPTAEQITRAFTAALASNPQLLCPNGGLYGSRQLALVGGGTITSYGCYGAVTAPIHAPVPVPAPVAATTSAAPTSAAPPK